MKSGQITFGDASGATGGAGPAPQRVLGGGPAAKPPLSQATCGVPCGGVPAWARLEVMPSRGPHSSRTKEKFGRINSQIMGGLAWINHPGFSPLI